MNPGAPIRIDFADSARWELLARHMGWLLIFTGLTLACALLVALVGHLADRGKLKFLGIKRLPGGILIVQGLTALLFMVAACLFLGGREPRPNSELVVRQIEAHYDVTYLGSYPAEVSPFQASGTNDGLGWTDSLEYTLKDKATNQILHKCVTTNHAPITHHYVLITVACDGKPLPRKH